MLGKTGYIHGVRSLSGYLIVPADASAKSPAPLRVTNKDPKVAKSKAPGKRPATYPATRTIGLCILFNDTRPTAYGYKIKQLRDALVGVIQQHVE